MQGSLAKELVVPIGIVAALAVMLLPLPTFLLDILLVSNLILALALLVIALSITDSLKLSSLPTMLLLATLFRLSLNISTTRLILGRGEAGHTVEAFGSLVVQGNLTVGLVVFLVITLVQFIVIAKGSERVAEVSARFTLDAMPGRQMSIDADVRAGLYDFEAARKKRQELQTESRFYGALDGAMKFIKGDAIAGIIIVAINIIGGLFIGTLIEGLDVQSAASKYTLLTVGDGLLAQIPALLNSLAAGMVVTRVSKGDDASLASELISQFGQLGRVNIMTGVFALLLAIVPGMPSLPLMLVGTFLLFSAFIGFKRKAIPVKREASAMFRPKVPPLFQVQFGGKALANFYSNVRLVDEMEMLRQRIFLRHGFAILPPEIGVGAKGELEYEIFFRGIPMTRGSIEQGDIGLEKILNEVEQFVEANPEECLDDIQTRRLLDLYDSEAPELISSVVPGIISITQLTEVLKGLAREGISIRFFDLILQAISESGLKASNARLLLEEVRVALKRVISHSLVGFEGKISGYVLGPALDLDFLRAEKEKGFVSTSSLESLISGVKKENVNQGENSVVLFVSKGARAAVRDALELRGVKATVIAHEEILEGLSVNYLGTIESNYEEDEVNLAA